jgi:hypothetical protein
MTYRSISRQRPKYAHATIEPGRKRCFYVVHIHPLLGKSPINTHSQQKTVFSVGSVPRSYLEENLHYKQLRVQLLSVNQRATEAEESPSLRLVTRKRLVITLQSNRYCGELLLRKD